MIIVVVSAALLGMVAATVILVASAGVIGLPTMVLAAAAAVTSGIALITQPFLGAAAMATFSHLDAVQKFFFGFLPVSAFKLITAATFAAVLVNARLFRDQVRTVLRNPIVVMTIVFMMLAVVSMFGAEDRALAMSAVQRLMSLGLLLVLVATVADTFNKVSILLWILVATSLVSSVLLILDFVLGVQLVAQSDAATTARTVERVRRSAGGSDYNPTTAAALLLVGIVFALVHALESRIWRFRLLVVVAIGTVAIILSFARSAALVYCIIGLALIWRYRRWRYLPMVAVAIVLAVLAALPLVSGEYWQRMSSIFGGASDPTLGRRLSYHLIGLDLFLDHPLFGVGPGNFPHHFTDISYRFMPGRILLGRELHNMYLSVLVQHGFIGAIPFFAILVLSIRQLRTVILTSANPAMRIHAKALCYAFAAYFLASLFLPNEETKYTWLLPGITVALYTLNEKQRRRS